MEVLGWRGGLAGWRLPPTPPPRAHAHALTRAHTHSAELDELERDVKVLGGEGGAPQSGEGEGGAGEETKGEGLPRNIRPCEVWQKMAVELDGMKTQLEVSEWVPRRCHHGDAITAMPSRRCRHGDAVTAMP